MSTPARGERAGKAEPGQLHCSVYDARMTSKHHQWKARWAIDETETLTTHENGLRVRLQDDGLGLAESADEVALLLTPLHGAHNATAMVQRLVREGAQMLIDPYARGWRN